MSAENLRRGRRVEKFVWRWLVRRGLKHVCSNFRWRFDVIAPSGTACSRTIDWRRQAFGFDDGLPRSD